MPYVVSVGAFSLNLYVINICTFANDQIRNAIGEIAVFASANIILNYGKLTPVSSHKQISRVRSKWLPLVSIKVQNVNRLFQVKCYPVHKGRQLGLRMHHSKQ